MQQHAPAVVYSAFSEFTREYTTVRCGDRALAVAFIIFELTFVDRAVRISQYPHSVLQVLVQRTNVDMFVLYILCAVSFQLALHPLALLNSTIRMNLSALAVI